MVNRFFQLVRLGIGHSNDWLYPNDTKWNVIKALAEQQGLLAIVVDGIERLPDALRPPKEQLLELIGEVLQGFDYRYDLYKRAIGELAGFYNLHGIKMMVVKGYACSLDWPKPKHRPCGDIDIWLFGRQKETDALLSSEKGITIDNSHHHHTVFEWNGFFVENHYDFINTHDHLINRRFEQLLKELGADDNHSLVLYNETVYLPSIKLHALFLLKHAMLHFVSGEFCLRQLLDWGFFVQKHTKELDWDWLESVLNNFNMITLYQLFNEICVEDFGFSKSIFPHINNNPNLKEKVLADILSPNPSRNSPKGLIPRILFRYKRWKNNLWKRELCYDESIVLSFCRSVWSHLLKPKSI